MPATTAPSAPTIGMPPAPGKSASGAVPTNPRSIENGSVVMRRRCSTDGSCCVAAIHAFERARAMPAVPPRSIRDADTSTPLAPTTAIAPRTPRSSALAIARAISARASASARSFVCIYQEGIQHSWRIPAHRADRPAAGLAAQIGLGHDLRLELLRRRRLLAEDEVDDRAEDRQDQDQHQVHGDLHAGAAATEQVDDR